MTKPLLNQYDRYLAATDTFIGAALRLYIARMHLARAVYRVFFKK